MTASEINNPVFVIGSGRSGTTWLHLMLGSHPQIATGQESQIFHNYFRSMRVKWEQELSYPNDSQYRFHGISAYINEDQFYRLLKQFSDGVFANVLDQKPSANIFLEKSPNNSFNIDTIFRCYPNAKFIHLVRDGRDVVASILAAGKGWGRKWAPKTVEPAAREWKIAVQCSRSAAELTPNYIELRYEDLLHDGLAQLKSLFDFLGVTCSDDEIQGIYNAHAFEKLKAGNYDKTTFVNPGQSSASGTNTRSEPRDFFRKGKAGDWQRSLSKSQQQEFNFIAGDLLEELGYAEKGSTLRKQPLLLILRHAVSDVKTALRRLIKSII